MKDCILYVILGITIILMVLNVFILFALSDNDLYDRFICGKESKHKK